MIVNGLMDYTNFMELELFEAAVDESVIPADPLPDASEGVIQQLLFDRFGPDSLMNNSLDTWMAHTEPLEIAARDCSLKTSVAPYRDRKHVLMEPLLTGPSQLLRPVTQVETFLVAAKRNFCVLDMTGAIDVDRESGLMLDTFLRAYTREGVDSRRRCVCSLEPSRNG
ncbi:hypothetical protein Q1695_007112 [Nippostrongylus brasiliensis]|nr:hypothetical protein Q1695_007112 [Nippostrongylus brasiliensis]